MMLSESKEVLLSPSFLLITYTTLSFSIDYENKVETLMFLPCFLFIFRSKSQVAFDLMSGGCLRSIKPDRICAKP